MMKKILGAICLAAAVAFIPSASLAARVKKPVDPSAAADLQRNAPTRANRYTLPGYRGQKVHHRRHHMKHHRRMRHAM